MKRFSKRTWVLVGVVAVAAVAAIGAYAYWTSTGTGSGSASTGTASAWVVTTSAVTGAALTPGVGVQTVAYHVKNNSTGNQALFNVNIKIANTVVGPPVSSSTWTVSGGTPDCTAGDFQLSKDGGTNWAAAGAALDDTALAGNVAPGITVDGSIEIRMINKLPANAAANNQDNCKSQTVPLFLAAS